MTMLLGFTVIGNRNGTTVRQFGNQPSGIRIARTADHAAVLIGRLHYREDLLARLPAELPARLRDDAETDDAALALAIYLRGGQDGLGRLEGEYALVVWDARQGCLIGA